MTYSETDNYYSAGRHWLNAHLDNSESFQSEEGLQQLWRVWDYLWQQSAQSILQMEKQLKTLRETEVHYRAALELLSDLIIATQAESGDEITTDLDALERVRQYVYDCWNEAECAVRAQYAID